MRNCWEFNPTDRPQFSDLVKTIMEMLSVLEHKMKQGQHRSNIQSTYVNVDKCTDYHYGNLENDDEKAPLASPLQTDLWPSSSPLPSSSPSPSKYSILQVQSVIVLQLVTLVFEITWIQKLVGRIGKVTNGVYGFYVNFISVLLCDKKRLMEFYVALLWLIRDS